METFEYKFVDLKREGVFSFSPEGNWQELVSCYGREGWRLVQIFGSVIAPGGPPKVYTFIFERRIGDDRPT